MASYVALLDFLTPRLDGQRYPRLPGGSHVLGTIVIGCFYLLSPDRISGSFGLKPPASDADTRAWLRLKGVRDVASGMAVLTMMLTTDTRTVGIVLLVFAIIPFGDMSNILMSGGRKTTAFSVHGVTCAVMLVVGFLLIHVI